MDAKFAVEWKKGPSRGSVSTNYGTVSTAIIRGIGEAEGSSFFTDGSSIRLEVTVRSEDLQGAQAILVNIDTSEHPFSFFLRDVNKAYPIYIPAYGIAVTQAEDDRTYEQIQHDVKSLNLITDLQRIDDEPEETFASAAAHTRELASQTWLGLSRDVRIFGVGFRGIGGEERLWDWVQPRFHGFEVRLPENEDKPVCYRYMLGRGVGCVDGVTRRLEDGTLPILHASIADNDVVYDTVSFVSYESSPLNADTLRGTHYLAADGFGHFHMLTEEQTALRERILPQEMKRDEETVLYFRAVATNKAQVPRYAWFKNVVPNAFVLNDDMQYKFDGDNGFVSYSEDRICCVSRLGGQPLRTEETAVLLPPGESVTFEFYLPHRPISRERAEGLSRQSFEERWTECRAFWREKLSRAASIKLPEPRIEEMVKAGLLHLDLVSYGLEPGGTIVPTIGVYTAIGSESSPIIQFMESMGWNDVAERALRFFLDKQHEDGLMQNYGGYMLETGAALWSLGEHYRYTRDEEWVIKIKDHLLKAFDYLAKWRDRNKTEELRGKGYGMLEGKTADPEDPFRSFMLNGYAYMGMSRLAEMLRNVDPGSSALVDTEAQALKEDIRQGLFATMASSPVVPLADGSWVPTVPPWAEHRGPLSVNGEGGKWLTHGSVTARDSLLGPLYLVFQEVVRPDEAAAEFMLNYHHELMCTRNVALSQPYYSMHPWVHLKRGEVKPFLKAYYNGFSGLADRETYTFWEHFWHASPHKTHEEGWFLMQTRWMLYMEDGEDRLNLLPGIPSRWLENGNVIELDGIVTYFGEVTLRVESNLERNEIVAKVVCRSDRKPNTVSIRLPHPEGANPATIIGGSYSASRQTILVEQFDGNAEITLRFD
ncbi:hypothetical protein M6D81_21125 [Paenibacillus sp. J5C_2022]|uniref:hypothetical protein n=1 Tax=Paenibacillus sp. J5C2022 TaxID=2977129 RepID=UPI0021D15C05|nr:hypothetical protein [Paenibacillus sp. J5C2022]MCU6711200.1 hypothetical protein [Paenibacillus sp. J5C2022]